MNLMQLNQAYASLSENEKAYLTLASLLPFCSSWQALGWGYRKILNPNSPINFDNYRFSYEIQPEVNQVQRSLKRKGFLNADHIIQPQLLHALTCLTFDLPDIKMYIDSVNQILEKWSYRLEGTEDVRLRHSIYANNTIHYENYARELPHTVYVECLTTYFIDETIPTTWLLTRPCVFLASLLRLLLDDLYIKGIDTNKTKELLTYFELRRNQSDYTYINSSFYLHDIFNYHKDFLINANYDGDKDLALNKCVEAVAVFLLKGSHEQSGALFQDAFKVVQKQTGKRKNFIPLPLTYINCLALLAQKTKESFKKLQDILDAEMTAKRSPAVFDAMQNVSYMLQGLRSRMVVPKTIDYGDHPPLDRAFLTLCMYWLDVEKVSLKICELEFDRYADSLPLVAKIFADIILELNPNHKPCAHYSAQDHFAHTVCFSKLIAIAEGWELALENLDTFFGGIKLESDHKEKRLVWLYDIKKREIIEVLEQSLNKTKWSKGRAVTLKRLYEHDNLPFITLEDQRIIKALRRERYSSWGSQVYFEWDKIKMHLAFIGHPRIYNHHIPEQALEFYVGHPELMIKQLDEKHFHLSLSHHSLEEYLFTDKETATRFRLVHVDESLLPLAEILGKKGIKVPTHAKDHIISIVQKAGLMLPIHSDVAEIDIQAQDGDATPCLQLQPLGEMGLHVQLLMRPFGDKGPYFRPAHGRTSVQMIDNMLPCRAKRNFDKERAHVDDVLQHCKILAQMNDGSDEWELEDPYDCLETLAELKEYEEKNEPDTLTRIKIEWPQGRKINLSEPVSFNSLKLSIKSERDWFSVSGTVQVDENTVLDLKQILSLLDQSRGRFIQLDDRKFIALTNGLKKQLQELTFFGESDKNGNYRVHNLGGHALKNFADQTKEVVTDNEWKKRLEVFESADAFTPTLPSTLQATLREYQCEGFDWMSRLAYLGMGACLADDMGLGKTVQALAVLLNHAPKGPCLVVAPTSVCHNWHEEIAKFAPTLNSYAMEIDNRAELINNLKPMDILICSYTLLQQEAELLKAKKFEIIVLDEAQAIKNATTKRFQAAIQLNGNFKLALSGTPIENGLDELWSLFRFIAPGLLGSKESFQKKFMTPLDKEKDQARRQALKNLIKAFILRRTKANVLQELPPKTEQTIHIDMEPEEKAFYEAVRQTAIDNITNNDQKSGQRKIHILAEITRLRRACCHPKLVDDNIDIPSSKLKVFLELVDELLLNNHKALIFSQYVSYLDLVRVELDKKGIEYQYLDGSTAAAERQKRVNAFQEGKSSLFLLSLKAGGAGLNLTAADYVIHMDPWWNPAVEDQASDRAHRMGQQRPVTIYRLVMKGSIEERILALHKDKRDLADDLLDGSQHATKLTEDDLIKLMMAA